MASSCGGVKVDGTFPSFWLSHPPQSHKEEFAMFHPAVRLEPNTVRQRGPPTERKSRFSQRALQYSEAV